MTIKKMDLRGREISDLYGPVNSIKILGFKANIHVYKYQNNYHCYIFKLSYINDKFGTSIIVNLVPCICKNLEAITFC